MAFSCLYKRMGTEESFICPRCGNQDPKYIGMLSNAVTNAQKQIEGKNFDIRKNLKDYDDVLAKQRDIIYKKRDAILMAEDIVNLVHGIAPRIRNVPRHRKLFASH